MAEDFPKLGRDLDTQVHEAHRFSLKVSSSRHFVINVQKIKKNLKSRKIKETYNLQGNPDKFIISRFTGSH